MAAMTRADMITKTLRRLGILASTETDTPEDSTVVGQVLDALHDELTADGLTGFATSSIPDWAQEGFSMALGEMVAPYFGLTRPGWREEGERLLARQRHKKVQRRPVPFKDF